MRWTGGRRSQNIEDRRGQRTPRMGRGIKLGGGGGGMGFDATSRRPMPTQQMPRHQTQRGAQPNSRPDDQLAEFTSAVLADTEDTWKKLLGKKGAHYQEPKLVLFSDAVQSGCGVTSAAAHEQKRWQ